MSYRLKVINDKGEALSLTDNPNYTVYKIDGLTPPQVNINQSTNSTQDGGVINSTRMAMRNLVLYMTVNGAVESNRIQLYKYFPPKHNVKLYYSNGEREVYIEGVVELIECDMFTNRQVAQISILCPQPYFKGVEDFVTMFSDVSYLFEFPFAIEKEGIEFSSITPNIRKSIIYAGDESTGVILDLFALGNVVNPVIYDVLKRTFIKLKMTLLEGDRIIINTNVGEKGITLIRNGVSYNAMGYMSHDSTWLTLEAGDNVYAYDTEGDNSNLQLTIRTTELYGGV